jgi:anti-sigma factor RsiW
MTDVKKDHREEDIIMYEEGFLDAEERAELEEHMRGCAECRATHESVKLFLPALQKALIPEEQSPEELLAWAKARMREEEQEEEKRPAGFFTRMRVAIMGFALAGAAAIAIAIQALLPSLEPALVAKGEDAGARAGVMSAPRRPGWDSASDVGSVGDGGEDAGSPHPRSLP